MKFENYTVDFTWKISVMLLNRASDAIYILMLFRKFPADCKI